MIEVIVGLGLLFLVVVGAWGAIGDYLESRPRYCKLCGYRCHSHSEYDKSRMED